MFEHLACHPEWPQVADMVIEASVHGGTPEVVLVDRPRRGRYGVHPMHAFGAHA